MPDGVLSSLANLPTVLRAQSLGRVIRLQGIVSDAALQSWELSYQRQGDTTWSSISGLQSTPVVDDLFLDWVPPAAGTWRIRLRARDLAGNQRDTFTIADAAGLPAAIVDVRASGRWLSPNGDGRLDHMRLEYRVDQPTTALIQVRDQLTGAVVRKEQRTFGAADLGVHGFEFDGRGDQGQILPDGSYRMELAGFGLPLTIDTRAPHAQFSWQRQLPLDIEVSTCINSFRPATLATLAPDELDLQLAQRGSAPGSGGTYLETAARIGGCPQQVDAAHAVDRQWRLRLEDFAGNQRLLTLPPYSPLLGLNGLLDHPSAVVTPEQALQALFVDVSTGLTELRTELRHVASGNTAQQWRLLGQHAGTRSPLSATQLGSEQWLGHGVAVPLDLRNEVVGSWVELRGTARTLGGETVVSNAQRMQIGQFPPPSLEGNQLGLCPVVVGSVRLPRPWRDIRLVAQPRDGGASVVTTGQPAADGNGLVFDAMVGEGREWQLSVSLIDGDGVYRSAATTDHRPCRPLLLNPERLEISSAPQLQSEQCGAPADHRILVQVRPTGAPPTYRRAYRLWLDHPLTQLPELLLDTEVAAHTLPPVFERLFNVNGWPAGQVRLHAELDGTPIPLAFEVAAASGPPAPYFSAPAAGARVCGSAFQVMVRDAHHPVLRVLKSEWGAGPAPESWLPANSSQDAYSTMVQSMRLEGQPHGFVSLRIRAAGADGTVGCATRLVNVDARVDAFRRGTADTRLTALPGTPLGLSAVGAAEHRQLRVPFISIEPVRWSAAVAPASAVAPLQPAGPELRTILAAQAGNGDFDLSWDGQLGGSPLPDGRYVLLSSATDEGCGHALEFRDALLVDNTPPLIEVQQPQEAALIEGPVLQVLGQASDAQPVQVLVELASAAAPQQWQTLPAAEAGVLARFNRGAASGPHLLRVTATDLLGNSSVLTRNIVLDAPLAVLGGAVAQPALFSPNGDGVLDQTRVEVEVRQAAVLDLRVQRDGQTLRVLAQEHAVTGGVHAFVWDGRDAAGEAVADGAYELLVRATAAGDATQVEQQRLQLAVDTAAPQFTDPLPAGPDLGCEQGFSVHVHDHWLDRYQLQLRNGAGALLRGLEGTQPGVVAFGDLAQWRDESGLRLDLRAQDRAGNTAAQSLPLALDCEAPVARLQLPQEQAVLARREGSLVSVTGTASDASLQRYWIESAQPEAPTAWQPLHESQLAVQSGELFGWAPQQADGPLLLRLRVRDRAGNEASDQRGVIIDGTPPLAELSAPAQDQSVTGTLRVEGSASDANLDYYQLQLARAGGESWETLLQRQEPVIDGVLGELAIPGEGEVRLRLRVVDRAGFESVTVPRRLRIDQVPPPAPASLDAHVEQNRHVRLGWPAVAAADLAGYRVQRGGTVLAALHATTTYLDQDVPEGRHAYQVHAVDQAGNASASPIAHVRIDHTPPQVAIVAPMADERIAGNYAVLGTASAEDLREYRLSWVPVLPPGPQIELRRSAQPVTAGELALLDTTTLAQDAQGLLRLQAEDLQGNVATVERAVVIDNLPPAAPTGLALRQVGADLHLDWNANAETDLLGYLLFRNGVPVNSAGALPQDLRVLALHAPQHHDRSVPDGHLEYRVYAIDRAGNLSPPSAPAAIDIETGPPRLQLLSPAPGQAFETTLDVLAHSNDQDIASVQFHWRALGTPDWNLWATLQLPPWSTRWTPPEGASHGDYELRALATDTGGRVDPAPPQVRVRYADLTAPDAPGELVAQADADAVQLRWDPSASPDLAGYRLLRLGPDGVQVVLTPEPITATEWLDGALADGRWTYSVSAVDHAGNASAAVQDHAQVFGVVAQPPPTPTLDAAVTISGHAHGAGQAQVQRIPELAQPVTGEVDEQGFFTLEQVPLAPGSNVLHVRVRNPEGDLSRPATLHLDRATRPAAPSGLQAQVEGTQVELSWQAPAEPSLLGYHLDDGGQRLPEATPLAQPLQASGPCCDPEAAADGDAQSYWYAYPDLQGGPVEGALRIDWEHPVLIDQIELDWTHLEARASRVQLEVWSGHHWIDLQSALAVDEATQHVLRLARPYRTNAVRLRILASASYMVGLAELRVRELPLLPATSHVHQAAEGRHAYTVSAWNWYGFPSEPSAPLAVDVGDVQAPDPVLLSGSVLGADAHLHWSASAAPDVRSYLLLRAGQVIAVLPAAAPREYVEAGLPNGRHHYTVRVVDLVGNVSADSNTLGLDVLGDQPAAPRLDAVLPLPAGGALALRWTPAASGAPAVRFEIERAASAQDPFTLLHATADHAWTDHSVSNGQHYAYRIVAVDARGNRSPASNVLGAVPGDRAAPPPPVLSLPTLASHPLVWNVPQVAVCGMARPGTQVQVSRNGLAQGGTLTALAQDRYQPVAMDGSSVLQARLAPQGDLYYAHVRLPSGVEAAQLRRLDGGVPVVLPSIPGAPRFSARGDELHGIGPQGQLLRFDPGSGQATVLAPVLEQVQGHAASADARHWVIAASHAGSTALWHFDRSQNTQVRIEGVAVDQLDLAALALDPQGTRLLLRYLDGRLGLLDLDSGVFEELSTTLAPSGAGPQWAPGQHSLAWVETTGAVWTLRVHVAGAATAQSLLELYAPPRALRYNSDGSELWVLQDRVLHRLRVSDGTELGAIEVGAPDYYLEDVQISASGRLLVVPTSSLTAQYFAVIDPAGSFCLRAVPTLSGSNRFTATAADAAGNLSAASAAAIVQVPATGRPDLAVSAADLRFAPSLPLVGDAVQAHVGVRNRGDSMASGAQVRVRWLAPDGTARNIPATLPATLEAGAQVLLGLDLGQVPVAGDWRLLVELDPADALQESDESNNVASASLSVAAHAGPQLELSLQQSSVPPATGLQGHARVVARAPFEGSVRIRVLDAAGVAVTTLAQAGTGSLAAGQAWEAPFHWLPDVFAGSYQVQAELLSLAGNVLEQRQASFQIQTQRQVLLDLRTDRQSYPEGATVVVNPSLQFVSGNALLVDARLRLSARLPDPGAPLAWSFERPLGTLTPGAHLDQVVPWVLGDTPPGGYTVELQLLAEGFSQQISQGVLVVPAQPLPGVLGSLRVVPGGTVAVGAPARLEWTLRNTGAAPLAQLPVRLRLLRMPDLTEILTHASSESLAAQQTVARSHEVPAGLLALGDHLAVLEAQLPGDAPAHWQRLAQAGLVGIDGTPPQIVLESPAQDGFAPRPTALRARVTDALSGVDRVELQLDGGPWTPVGVVEDGRYGRTEGALAEGLHQFRIRATDRQGNQSQSALLSFSVDATPPQITLEGLIDGQHSALPLVPVVHFSDAHLHTTRLRLNGEDFNSGTSVGEEGVYYLHASATDLAGNRTDRAWSFHIDRTGPVVVFVSPDPEVEIASDTVAVNLLTEAGAQVFLTNGAWSDHAIALHGPAMFPAVPLLPGSNPLQAHAVDAAGNTGPLTTLTLVRGKGGANWLGDLLPAAPQVASGALLQLQAHLQNNSQQPRTGRFRVRSVPSAGAGVVFEFSHEFAPAATHVQALSLPTEGWALGSHALVLELLDDATVLELATTTVQVVDVQPPQLQILTAPLIAALLTIEVDARDALSAIVQVQARLDAGAWMDLAALPGDPGRYGAKPLAVAEGSHLLEVRALDSHGNQALASLLIESDQSAPWIGISGVSDGQLANVPLTPVVKVADAHPGSHQLTLDGKSFVSGTPVSVDGVHTLRVVARDAVDNLAERSITFTIDQTPPLIQLSQPLPGQLVLAAQVPVSGSTEPSSGVLLQRGGYQSTTTADAKGAFGFPAVPLQQGLNVIQLRATDPAGNTGPVHTLEVEYRLNAGVELQATLDAAATSVQGAPLPVRIGLHNPGTLPAQQLPLRLRALPLGQADLLDQFELHADLAPGASSESSHGFATQSWPLGSIELRLEAWFTAADGSQAWTVLASRSVLLRDGGAPQLDWIAPAPGSWHSTGVRVAARASDEGSGIAQVRARLGEDLPVLLEALGGDLYEALLPTHAEGALQLLLEAVDGAGNLAAAPPRTVQVDRQPPQVDILEVVDGQIGRDPVTPRIRVKDANAVDLELRLNGQPYIEGTPVSAEGSHLLLARATDPAGNSGQAQAGFTIDLSPPPLEVLHPLDGAVLLGNQVKLVGRSEPAARIRIDVPVLGLGTEAVADASGQFIASLTLARGHNTLLLMARDVAGNTSPPLRLSVMVQADPLLPLAGTLQLPGTEHAHGQPLQVLLNLRNLGQDVLTAVPVSLKVTAPGTATTVLAQWQVQVDLQPAVPLALEHHFATGDWPLGLLRVSLEADLDAAGSRGPRRVELASQQLQLVDRTAPLIELLAPLPNQTVPAGSTLLAAASDPLSGIARVEARLDEAGAWLPLDRGSSAPDHYGRALQLAAGPHRVELRAIDAAGNTSTVGPVAFLVQRTVPLSVSEPADGSATHLPQVRLAGLTEPGARVALRRAGVPRAEVLADPQGRFLFATVPLEFGINPFTLLATAADGAHSAELSLQVRRHGLARIAVHTLTPGARLLLVLLLALLVLSVPRWRGRAGGAP